MIPPKTVEDWRAKIARERGNVGRKPYSHNIISIALGAIEKLVGMAAVNQAIEDFKLERLGWRKTEETHDD